METKHCGKCGEDLPTSKFYKNRSTPTGYARTCKSCHKIESQAYRHKHADIIYQKELANKNKIKLEVFTHYCDGTPVCKHCGFSDIRALSIDHINGGGRQHRNEIKRNCGTDFYRWLRDNNHPDGFQVLCYNCQIIKRFDNNEHGGKHKTAI